MFEYSENLANEIKNALESVQTVKLQSSVYKMRITNQAKDRDWEIINIDGIDTDAYMKNPIVLIDHAYKINSIVGKTVKLYSDGSNLIAEFVFADTENGILAQKLYDGWFLKTSSIGFIVKERQADNFRVITKCELLEWSLVAVPCNPLALSLDSKEYQQALEIWLVKEDDLATIKSDIAEIKTLIAKLADGKAQLEEEVEEAKKKKEFLQLVNRATSQALEGLKKL